jgi:uncharacterized coiled-coil protein SlyX
LALFTVPGRLLFAALAYVSLWALVISQARQKQAATITQLKSVVAKEETTAAHQQEQIEALTAGLQRVSAQVEMSRPVPQMVLNNQ